MTARNVSRTYQKAFLASALGCRRRASHARALDPGDRFDELAHRRLGHVSPAWPRSRKRTLTIEKTSVTASSAMAIADAYPAWPSWKACFHR